VNPIKPDLSRFVKGESVFSGTTRDYGSRMSTSDPRRVDVSKRLKAARQLAGYVDERGKVVPLPVGELVLIPDIAQNGISKNRVEEIEQMKVDARPMELKTIALALSLPEDWFARGGGEPINQPIADLLQVVESAARAHRRGEGEAPGESGAEGRPGAVDEGAR
jgi:transcriptional regulator with XRE-family HTH domain